MKDSAYQNAGGICVNTEEYIGKIIAWFSRHADPANAEPMKRYMKNQFDFLGIRAPKQRELNRAFIKKTVLPDLDRLDGVIKHLWNLPEREYQYLGIAIMRKMVRSLSREDIQLIERMVTSKPWWDTVDVIAAHVVGPFFTNHPDMIEETVEAWLASDHMWLQRTAILHQLTWKSYTNERMLYMCVERCMDSKEFFIRKAIGWALREYSKTEPESVIAFVRDHPGLSGLSTREALKVVTQTNRLEWTWLRESNTPLQLI
jgi:3-methyladenine DNA glycosylase AlkD